MIPDGHSDVEFLDGPSKGAIPVFIASSRQCIESRRYGWATGGQIKRAATLLKFNIECCLSYKAMEVMRFAPRMATVSLRVLGVKLARSARVQRAECHGGLRMLLAIPHGAGRGSWGCCAWLWAWHSGCWLAGLALGLAATRVLGYIVYQAASRDPILLAGAFLAMLLRHLSHRK